MLSQIIFVSGYMHTSTTLIGAMLESGNPNVKFAGEVQWLKIGDKNYSKTKYARVYNDMKNDIDVYQSMSNRFKASVVIDSSKQWEWVSPQFRKHIRNSKLIIVYKEPLEIVHSMYKRGCSPGAWMNAYANLYMGLLTLADYKMVISYKDLVTKTKRVLKGMCAFTGIPYFPNKEFYWNYPKINIVAGCSELMNNYFDINTPKFQKRIASLTKKQNRSKECVEKFKKNHKKIYYDNSWKNLPIHVVNKVKANKKFMMVGEKLNNVKSKFKES